ncbi:hypothetical protein ACTPEO_17195 [Clostridioides difficile]
MMDFLGLILIIIFAFCSGILYGLRINLKRYRKLKESEKNE